MIMNARMYAVTPEAEAAWRSLLGHVTAEAGLSFDYLSYPAPQPLEDLWSRPDLGCVFMCGYPLALGLADVVPIAAPIPDADWAQGRAVYRSDLIVRRDAPFQNLEDTFGGVAGWTVAHSHSGFNAFRHHLLAFRTPERPTLYRQVKGNLVTARRILDGVLDGSLDVGPLDAYWHRLIALHKPELTAGVRVIGATELAPSPAFVASPALPADAVSALKASFAACASRDWFAPLAGPLCLTGFTPVGRDDFATTLAWDREAIAAGYPVPA
jgi:ABC-type phosphate/phosphonate transport system substrate-binding protein